MPPVITKVREAVVQLFHPLFMFVAVEDLPGQTILKHPFTYWRADLNWRDSALVGVVAIQPLIGFTYLTLKARYLLAHQSPLSQHFEVNVFVSYCHLPPCSLNYGQLINCRMRTAPNSAAFTTEKCWKVDVEHRMIRFHSCYLKKEHYGRADGDSLSGNGDG